jgi:integrase
MGKLTALKVKNAKAGMHADGDGLYLQVGANGSASWIFRYRLNGGGQRYLGLGSLKAINLAAARELAAEARTLKAKGVDPIERRDQERTAARVEAARAVTFSKYADQYIDSHEAGWRNDVHRRQWRNSIDQYAKPILGHMALSAIDTAAVLRVLQPIWHDKPETASRIRGRIESILDAAKLAKLRDGENPARWRGHLSHMLPSRHRLRPIQHFKALPYTELPAFMAVLRARPSLSARALEFTILTAARAEQACGARWEEIDLTKAVWTIPASRMKAGKQHRVPLTGRALEILQEYAPDQRHRYVFPSYSGKSLGIGTLGKMLALMGCDVTTHGFRSTFKDWADEQTGHANHVVEMALAHAVGNGTEQAYRRGDLLEKRRQLMADWEGYCRGKKD